MADDSNVLRLKGLGPPPGLDPVFGGGRVPIFGTTHYVFLGEAPMVVGPVWIPDEQGYVFKMRPSRRRPPDTPYRPAVIPDEYETRVHMEEGEDPHVAFYRAATQFRQHIARETEKIANEIPEWESTRVDLVTVAFTPIIAVPLEDKGFYLMATCGQFATKQGHVLGTEGHDLTTRVEGAEVLDPENRGSLLSTTGEFPIKAPNNIEMQLLIRLDHEVITRKVEGNTRDLMLIYRNKVVRVR